MKKISGEHFEKLFLFSHMKISKPNLVKLIQGMLLENLESLDNERGNSIMKQNFEFLLQGPKKSNKKFINYLNLLHGVFLDHDASKTEDFLSKLVEEVPQLKSSKIKRILGSGTEGVVFELDNGRALKIYKDLPEEDKESFYDKENGKIFSGKGKIMTLPIFDQGETSFGIKYVEMAKVLPFNIYLEITSRKPVKFELFSKLVELGYYVAKIKENPDVGSVLARYRRMLLEFYREASKNNLTEHEALSMFNMIEYVVMNYGVNYLNDIFEENFGVLEQTLLSDKPVFVLFDP